ncbi:hypothetical protein OROGR_031585 [Orobanche gracilis]
MSYRRDTSSSSSSIVDAFSLNPMPYPVLIILAVISIFLGLKWYVSYESAVEAAEESMGWLLIAAPLVLIFAVRLLATSDNPGLWFHGEPSPLGGRWRNNYLWETAGGGSPWVVAALILMLLVLVQYQSAFLESWFI